MNIGDIVYKKGTKQLMTIARISGDKVLCIYKTTRLAKKIFDIKELTVVSEINQQSN